MWFCSIAIGVAQGLPGEDRAKRLVYLANSNGLLQDSSRHYLSILDSFARVQGLVHYETTASYLLGKYYLLRLEAREAHRHFSRAAHLAESTGDFEQQGFALDRIGLCLVREDKLDSALIAFQSSMDLYQFHDLGHRLWAPLQGISSIYQKKGDYASAKKFGERALASLEGFDEEIAKSIVLNHMLSIATAFEQYDDYAKYLDDYLSKLDPVKLGEEDMHVVAFFSAEKDPDKRIATIQKAIDRLSKHSPSLSLLSSYFHLGKAYVEKGELTMAIKIWSEGHAFGKSLEGVGYGVAFAKELSDAFADTGDYANALHYRIEYDRITDSLANVESAKAIDELQLKYETAQKEQTILAQQFEIEQNARQRNILILLGAVILGLGLMVIYVLRARLKAQQALAEKEIENLRQNNRLLTLNAMLRGQEEERKRIAFDLHDGLGGLLSTVKLEIQKLFDQQNLQALNGEAGHASQMLDDACSEVRRIAHNMMPHALMKMGLHAAISDMTNALSGSTGIDIAYENLSDIDRLEENQEIMLYRIVQELVQNAIKHANPHSILIQLSQHNGTLSLVVEDDGHGFDPAQVSEGIGLHSLESRVQFLNGTTEITSAPGTGTTVAIDVPFQATNSADLYNIGR